MKIEIHSIADKGNLEKEIIWLKVLDDVEDLEYYMVSDTTYTDTNHISNEHRHIYWFPKKSVKKGDWIALRTKNGKQSSASNKSGTITHTFYWNLGRTIWNKDGDSAILFNIKTWKAHSR
jgi:hypothetical protein